MKIFALAFFGALVADLAFACPNLAGEYNCSWAPHLTIEMTVKNGASVYHIENEDLIADGLYRKSAVVYADGTKTIYLQVALCDAGELKSSTVATLAEDTQFFTAGTVLRNDSTTYALDALGSLVIQSVDGFTGAATVASCSRVIK